MVQKAGGLGKVGEAAEKPEQKESNWG